VTRARLLLAALAAVALALPLGAGALDAAATDKFSATVTPAAVQPISTHDYTIAILNRGNSDDSAQSAHIDLHGGFVVDPTTLAARRAAGGGCTAADWTATLGADSIDVAAPDAASELDHGCTLNVTFSAVAPALEGTYEWTTSVSHGITTFAIQGSQPAVTVDGTAPPAPSLTSEPANPSSDTSPSFGFSDTDAGATFRCQLDGGGFTACTSPKTYNGVGDGPHAFDVKAVDAAGNESDVTSYQWTIDTAVPPPPSIDSHPADPSNDDPVSFAFSDGEDGAGFQCKLDGAAFASCTSPKTYSVGDGSHTFQVKAVDGAGNASSSVSYKWAEDKTAPTITLTTKPANPTKDQTPTFAFNANETVTGFVCSLDGAPAATCASPITYGEQAEGSHTFTVQATDAAGNTGSTSYTWTIDVTPPTFTLTQKPTDPSADSTPTFAFSADETVTGVQCKLDSGSFANCSSPKTYSSLADGSHTFTVRGTDAAGNTGSSNPYTWTIDTKNPVVTLDNEPPNPTNQTSATFSFESSKNPSTYKCKLDGGAFETCTSPKSYGPAVLGEGPHTFSVEATDSLNHTGPVTSYDWTIDLTPPAPPSIAPGAPPATNQTSVSFVFTGEAGATFQCRLDGAAFSACTSPAGYSALADGAHQFAVRATDAAGNTGAAASYGWTVDTIAPETTITHTPDAVSGSPSATFEFASDEPLTSFGCSLDGSAFASCSSPQTYSGLANGTHTFQVRASDLAGNTDPTPASYTWRVATLTPPDTTPPGPVRRLKRSVAYRLLKLTWARPPDADFDHVRVLVSRKPKSTPRAVVYQGKALSYVNKRFQNGTYYRYAVVSYDHAGNASRSVTVTVPASALLRSPADGAVVKLPPRLLWAAVAKATYYNVQLYSPRGKLLSAWPTTAQLSLSRSWSYAGRQFVLTKGLYRWFVWPGFGPRSEGRYGQLLGQSSFRVR
jgi:hypothetical protein